MATVSQLVVNMHWNKQHEAEIANPDVLIEIKDKLRAGVAKQQIKLQLNGRLKEQKQLEL
ncbi:MAG: hypothetical protein ACPGUD_08635 [Parashewanella sp.]